MSRTVLIPTATSTRAVALLALLCLVACGADGDPERMPNPNVTVSGTAKIGVTGRY